MHVSQWRLNILIHSLFLFLFIILLLSFRWFRTPYFFFGSEDVTTVFLGLCEHLFLGFRRFHLYSRWAQTTCRKHRTSIYAVSLDGPPIGSSHARSGVHWMDRPSAQAMHGQESTGRTAYRLKPRSGVDIDGPPIGSSHGPESTRRTTHRLKPRSGVNIDGPPIGSSHCPESNILYI